MPRKLTEVDLASRAPAADLSKHLSLDVCDLLRLAQGSVGNDPSNSQLVDRDVVLPGASPALGVRYLQDAGHLDDPLGKLWSGGFEEALSEGSDLQSPISESRIFWSH